MSILLEVCVDSFASAQAAKVGGADRLEVCSALAVGGTTPNFGLVEQCVADLQMPVMMMIRPHDGGFVYDNDHFETMLTNIEVAKSLGVQGIVFGALTADMVVDGELCKRVLEAADTLETTFHRAFDIVPDPFGTLAELENMGFDRVLTSGQQASAMAGATLLKSLTEAANRISVLAGAGVNASNAKELVQQTGVSEIHASASVAGDEEQSKGDVRFGGQRRVTCSDKVREIKEAVA